MWRYRHAMAAATDEKIAVCETVLARELDEGDTLTYAHRKIVSVEREGARLHVVARSGSSKDGYRYWHYRWMPTTPIIIIRRGLVS